MLLQIPSDKARIMTIILPEPKTDSSFSLEQGLVRRRSTRQYVDGPLSLYIFYSWDEKKILKEEKSMIFRKSVYFVLLLAAAAILINLPPASHARGKLNPTPSDHEGPFYPVVRQQDEDHDLIHVDGRDQAAQGDILHLSGKVVNEDGQPFSQAVVEIWQTDPNGRYNDARDRSPGSRDPDFQYWGKALTREDGTYSFTTLVPGAYNPRPAHIHFKVWIDGEVRLTSQIYFKKKEVLNQPATPELQTVELQKNNAGEYEAFFQIVL
ncbi:MAG: hypothetical protein M8357_14250 [Desulfobulbaceae bacterium]|nr:hypothetical protein [Desulfobulbaceae bacterium]